MIRNSIKRHVWILALAAVFLLVNIWFLVNHPGSIFNEPERFGQAISTYGSRDASLYSKMAWQLINEGIYGYNADYSNAYVTPGQPFYLVAIYKAAEFLNTNHIMLTRVANMLLNIGIVFLLYLISIQLFRSKWIGLLSAFLYALHIAPYHYFRTALTEIPSLFLMLACVSLFLAAISKNQYRYHIIFGIAASIMLMFRPTPAPILLLAWAIVLYRSGFKEGVKIGFIWTIGPVLIMVPWVIRNFALFGHAYLFSSHAGSPLLGGTSPFYLEDQAALVQEAKQQGISLEEYGKQRIAEGFKSDFPLFFSWFTIGKTLWLFVDQQGNPDGLGPYAQFFSGPIKGFFKLQNMLVVLAAFSAMVIFRKHKEFMLLSSTVIIYIVFSNIFLTIPRYGLLIYPILCLIASYGIFEAVKKGSQFFHSSRKKEA
ncbi:phospholipid carrier-dependent glycosyltransferase [Bacillus infantis]|uniref:phospholipid carrier-dependent glycosyltransferase n=1 Tax=Bacillus infantis TaxID=324767 RepID=UPI003CF016E6